MADEQLPEQHSPEQEEFARVLMGFLFPPPGLDAPSAEQVGVQLSTLAGLPADHYDVGVMDDLDAELERLAWDE